MGASNILNDWKMVIFMCLTLGLAPFLPEPHLVGKIRWIAGGANGMATMDWLDFFWHLLPWLLLLRLVFVKLVRPALSK